MSSGLKDKSKARVIGSWILKLLAALLILITAAFAAWRIIAIGYSLEWTGFGEYTTPTGEYVRGKTLWDWIQLIFAVSVTGMLAYFGYQFNERQKNRETRIAEENTQETVLQTYLDQIGKLLLDNSLSTQPTDAAKNLARVWTITTLRRVNPDRKGIILRFLYESDLIQNHLPVISLENADLREVCIHDTSFEYVNFFGADLSGADLRGVDLSHANLTRAKFSDATQLDDKWRLVWEIVNEKSFKRYFSGVDLSEANFREADLRWANFGEANLSLADMSDSQLQGVDFSQAILAGASLNAVLTGTRFIGATLVRADLSGADSSEADFTEADLSWANLSEARLKKAAFLRANLSDADLKGADFSEASFRDATLSRANLSGASFSSAYLRGANLEGASLSEADFSKATLSRANLSGANLVKANLRGAFLTGTDFRGADLGGAILEGADLEGAILERAITSPTTVLPDGSTLPQ